MPQNAFCHTNIGRRDEQSPQLFKLPFLATLYVNAVKFVVVVASQSACWVQFYAWFNLQFRQSNTSTQLNLSVLHIIQESRLNERGIFTYFVCQQLSIQSFQIFQKQLRVGSLDLSWPIELMPNLGGVTYLHTTYSVSSHFFNQQDLL